MWEQTVTVYRKEGDQILRRVLEGCFYRWKLEQRSDEWGSRQQTSFLLVIPGEDPIRPGDRVYDGDGPQVSAAQWAQFLPVHVPGLSEVAYTQVCRWNDRVAHTEAGRK